MVQFPGFTIHWPVLAFLHICYSVGPRQCSVSLRQVQTSKQDNHVVQRKFAFNRQFVRGSVGTPEGNSSMSRQPWDPVSGAITLDLRS